MTRKEYDEVNKFASSLFERMTKATEAINAMNFGVARAILSEPVPALDIRVDIAEGEDYTALTVTDTSTSAVVDIKRPRKKQKEAVSALKYPYDSEAFISAWNRLASSAKWRKKDVSKLQWNLDRLAKYPEAFCLILLEEAYNGDWQGVVFESTPSKYERWMASQGLVPSGGRTLQTVAEVQKPSKVMTAMTETQKAFDKIDSLFPPYSTDEQ